VFNENILVVIKTKELNYNCLVGLSTNIPNNGQTSKNFHSLLTQYRSNQFAWQMHSNCFLQIGTWTVAILTGEGPDLARGPGHVLVVKH